MDREEEIKKLDRLVRDSEIRSLTFQASIDALNKELDSLMEVERALSNNIRCLKAKKIIAVAQEFKKAKEDLKKTHNRMNMLTNDRIHYLKACNEVKEFAENVKKQLAKLQNNDNVLQFKRKHGSK